MAKIFDSCISAGYRFVIGLLLVAELSSDLAASPSSNVRPNVERGMYVLGGWGLLNITGSLVAHRSGANGHFDQMNGMWNVVNVAIAGATLAGSEPMESQKYQELFAFNAGLDTGYMMAGLFLREKSKSQEGRSKQRTFGYGNSIMIQGAFLFFFDLGMWIALDREDSMKKGSSLSLSPIPNGLALERRW